MPRETQLYKPVVQAQTNDHSQSWRSSNKQLLRRSGPRALKILQCGPDTHLPQPAVLGVDGGKANKNEADKCACAVKIRVACCAACRFASEAPHVHTTPSLRLDTSGEWDDTWSHGDEMTHGCHFWCRGDRPRAGEHAILTPSPTGAGPPALSLRTGPKTPPFRKEPRRDISKGTLHPNHFARGLPSNQVSACNKPVTCSSE